jgi:hypothetical protein
MLLLHYALMALTAVSSGQEKRRTPNLGNGPAVRFDKTEIRNKFEIPNPNRSKMALPMGLAPTLFPQTTGCFSVQLQER